MPKPKKRSKGGFSSSTSNNFEKTPEEINTKQFSKLQTGFKRKLKW